MTLLSLKLVTLEVLHVVCCNYFARFVSFMFGLRHELSMPMKLDTLDFGLALRFEPTGPHKGCK